MEKELEAIFEIIDCLSILKEQSAQEILDKLREFKHSIIKDQEYEHAAKIRDAERTLIAIMHDDFSFEKTFKYTNGKNAFFAEFVQCIIYSDVEHAKIIYEYIKNQKCEWEIALRHAVIYGNPEIIRLISNNINDSYDYSEEIDIAFKKGHHAIARYLEYVYKKKNLK